MAAERSKVAEQGSSAKQASLQQGSSCKAGKHGSRAGQPQVHLGCMSLTPDILISTWQTAAKIGGPLSYAIAAPEPQPLPRAVNLNRRSWSGLVHISG